MLAVILPEPGRVELAEVPDPSPRAGEVVLSVDACGICGTDLHIYDGEFAPTPYPITPGHEFSGEVVAVGEGVDLAVGVVAAVDPTLPCGRCSQCRRGRPNLCDDWAAIGDTTDGAFAEYVRVPAENVYPLPESVPRRWGAFVEPLACAVHALDRLPPCYGHDTLVYGSGTMGLVLAQLLRHAGAARVDMIEIHQGRRERARAIGADAVAGAAAELQGDRWDVVVDATGAPPAIEDALTRVRRGGTLLLFGVAAADARVPLSPFAVYNDEISVVGTMAILHSFQRAIDLLAAGAVDPDELITHRLPLRDYERGIATVRAGDGLKTQLQPRALDTQA